MSKKKVVKRVKSFNVTHYRAARDYAKTHKYGTFEEWLATQKDLAKLAIQTVRMNISNCKSLFGDKWRFARKNIGRGYKLRNVGNNGAVCVTVPSNVLIEAKMKAGTIVRISVKDKLIVIEKMK